MTMSEAKFTPGPWARHDTADYAEIHPASGRQKSAIALVGRVEDADLTVAAPDMFAALSDIKEKLCEGFCKDLPSAGTYDASMDDDCSACRARSVLAKATGVAP